MQRILSTARDVNRFRNVESSYFPISDEIAKDALESERVSNAMTDDEDNQFDKDKVDEFDRFLLMYSSYHGNLGIVLMLLNKATDVET